MTQTATFRNLFRTAPGHMYSPAQERETESLCAPFVLQELTITLAGADPFAADADLTIVFPLQDGSGNNGEVGPITIVAGTTLAQAAAQVAAAWNATPQAAQLYTAESAAAVVTLVANSANTSIAATSIVGTFTDAHTATTAQTVAAAAPSLRMGLWYVYGAIQASLAISGTPRGARPAALPSGGTVVADLRGIIARVVNQTTLSPTFNSIADFDTYPAGQVFPGMLRGEVAAVVDPASGTMTETSQVHVVIAAGAYSVIGAVASAADGGNTLRLDNTTPVRARVTQREETLAAFSGMSLRLVPLRVNQTN